MWWVYIHVVVGGGGVQGGGAGVSAQGWAEEEL